MSRQPMNIQHMNYHGDVARGIARAKGFTLLELMMVIAIVAIISSMAAPPLGRMIDSNKISKASSDLSWSMLYARSEADKRNQSVNVTKMGSDWSDGWQVKFGAQVLETFDGIPDVTLTGPGTLEFLPNGRAKVTGDDYFVLEAEDSTASVSCIYINQSGVTTILVDRNGDGNCANG